MDMGPSSTGMAMSPTMSMASTASASSTGMSHGDMDMGAMTCKISMMWNWNTIGACFLSPTWRITSSGMFAGSCIGVILLVISLEFLRRVQREYDAYLQRENQKAVAATTTVAETESELPSPSTSAKKGAIDTILSRTGDRKRVHTRPLTLIQRQFLRALVHMLQFGVAYFVMLLAMYYNGYLIICILIGAFLGSFIFSWDQLYDTSCQEPRSADVTGCCG
ncbi:Ctr-domain-containing protein [Myriangium duriaei CBS 260.36]|uniref:Copper transport protein n=1 Tax=Myriangium duriaei CBS 260.36 TaxID=1168546 RepID=A0A9P4J124_9PEZI|nr:Ctr-domain-containing protein [Myriangium duriaei CBS 260.36]